MPRSGRFMGGEKKGSKTIHRINGFLSLQLELRLELGLRLSLTNGPNLANLYKYELIRANPRLSGQISMGVPNIVACRMVILKTHPFNWLKYG